jgi:large subunit ribosomal protein L21
VGTPRVAGASVSVEVVDQVRGDKIIIFKKKRRKGYRRRNGHRQHHTLLKVTGIRGA